MTPSGIASLYYNVARQKITDGFRVDFTYLMTNFSPGGPADGFAFVIQMNGLNAIGTAGIICFSKQAPKAKY